MTTRIISTFGIINPEGKLVEVVTTGQTHAALARVTAHTHPGHTVKPVEEWTDEQRAEYWTWPGAVPKLPDAVLRSLGRSS